VSARRLTALLVALALSTPAVAASGADYTAASASPGNHFATVADFNTVSVSLADPGTPLRGEVTLTATASSDRGIAGVRFESAPAGGGTWTEACAVAAPPYTCAWDSGSVATGPYDIRAVATDLAGYSRASVVASRMIDAVGPLVTLVDPGPWLQGSVAVAASASDTGTGVAGLTLQYRRAGTIGWADLCTTGAETLACSLDAAAQADGDLELRAVAVDGAANSRSTPPLTRRVDNTAPTAQAGGPAVLRGTVTLTADAGDGAGTGVASVAIQHRPSGSGAWATTCTDATAPYSCTLDTTALSGLVDVRAVATDVTGLSTASAVVTRRVDNVAPATPTLANPGTTLQGTVDVTGTAADAESGVASWALEYRAAGGATWTPACSDGTAPYGCAWNTTAVADGLYDLRAVATDGGGLTKASAALTSRRVDNLGPTVTLGDPGTPVRGSVTLTATATDPAGVSSVVFERKATSSSTWTTICTVNASPWTCAWNTGGAADGVFDLRVRATDTLGHVSVATIPGRQIDNTAPVATDVQGRNGGAVAGRPDAGDWLQFTWSETVSPASILAGWAGTQIPVTVTITDANKKDTVDIGAASGTLNLLSVAGGLGMNADVVGADTVFDATMAQAGASITITLGARRSGTVKTAPAAAMTWRAPAAVKDAAGNASAALQVTEPGAADTDF
jgi:chitinase